MDAGPALPPPPPTAAGRGRGRGRGRGGRGRGGASRGRGTNRGRGGGPSGPGASDPAAGGNASAPPPAGRGRGRRRRPKRGASTGEHGKRAGAPDADDLPAPAHASAHASVPVPEADELVDLVDATLPASDGHALSELSARLSAQLLRGALECLVCLERIRRDRATWACGTCHVVVHLSCARKWATGARDDDNGGMGMVCPSCRAKVDPGSLRNKCFCGRRRPLPLTPGVVPGSCGEPCLKPRGHPRSGCPHRCTALCHPGPCAPCAVLAPPQPCHCGKRETVRRCGEPADKASCGEVCGRPRPCGHACDRVCHAGECGECAVPQQVACHCGATSAELVCGVSGFSCGEVCGKPLACGHHTCEQVCHDGDCPPCPRSPAVWTTCACGKTQLPFYERDTRKSCVDPLISCGQPCDRDLGCLGKHKCDRVCGHAGDCGPCARTVEAECRCGASTKTVPCGGDPEMLRATLVCERKCNDRLKCRAHSCQTVCCALRKRKVGAALSRHAVVSSASLWPERAADAHSCGRRCEKELQCGKHVCDLACGHRGDCPPCGLLVREPVTCACGAAVLPAPQRCGTAAPPCSRPCSRARPCGHACPDRCHEGACPPCVEMVRTPCVGGHNEARFVPCHIGVKGIRCHRACGRPLRCGVHACRRPCHADAPRDCDPSSDTGCNYVCGLARRACEHSCQAPCHPGFRCPDVACRAPVRVSCPCGRRVDDALCLRGGSGPGMGGGVAPLPGDGKSHLVRLQCDDECAAQARLRAFASAVGRDDEGGGDGAGAAAASTNYSDFLLQFGDAEPAMLAHFERQLGAIVLGRATKAVLPDLPQLHRFVLHSLAELYGLESASTGKATARTLVVRHRGAGHKPVFPAPLLSEALARRDAARRAARNAASARSLAVFVHPPASATGAVSSSLDARVERVLREHAGAFRLARRATVAGAHAGIVVEFSTPERAAAALDSLRARPGVVVEPVASGPGAGAAGATSAGLSTSASASAAQAGVTQAGHAKAGDGGAFSRRSWNADVAFGGLAAIRQAVPAGPPAGEPWSPVGDGDANRANADDDATVPDSWDDD